MIRTITPITSILLAILMGVFFMQPEYDRSMEIQGEVAQYREAIQQYDNFTALLNEKLDAKNNRSPLETEQLNLLVPEDINAAQLLVDLESLAKERNLLFGNIEVSDNEPNPRRGSTRENEETPERDFREQLRVVDISFEVIGTYEQFKDFLRTLEQSATLYEVINLSFTATEDQFQQFAVTVRIHALSQ